MSTSMATPGWLCGCVTPLGPLRLDAWDMTYRLRVRIEVGDVCTERVLEAAERSMVESSAFDVLRPLREQAVAAARELASM